MLTLKVSNLAKVIGRAAITNGYAHDADGMHIVRKGKIMITLREFEKPRSWSVQQEHCLR